MANFQITRAAKAWGGDALVAFYRGPGPGRLRSHQNDYVTLVFEPLCRDVLFIINQSDHRNGWRWINNAERAFVVQRDISASNRCSKRAAGFGHAFNSFTQLPEIFRFIRVAEIQTIGDGQGSRARAGEIACRFSDSDFAAFAG